ncbi:hypothetical protein GLV95_04415 [Staphylococcus agnetis]|uniref:hypothetical protein n=1 Tax=Staphylococcus agnetis TaxID=985762 RepID=UPI001431D62F|nr:hypothetical protein [Staphylococcus agnetis]NJI15226.1 hypothetical protein [Staphylococcus agnetis]
MKEAQMKVLELLEAHKISVESAAILLDAMYGKTHEHHNLSVKQPNTKTCQRSLQITQQKISRIHINTNVNPILQWKTL